MSNLPAVPEPSDPEFWRRVPRSFFIRAGFWFSWGMFLFYLDLVLVAFVVLAILVGIIGVKVPGIEIHR